jgi:hypothetical protein
MTYFWVPCARLRLKCLKSGLMNKHIVKHIERFQEVFSGLIFHFWCPVPVLVRTNEQTYRETYQSDLILVVHIAKHIVKFIITNSHSEELSGTDARARQSDAHSPFCDSINIMTLFFLKKISARAQILASLRPVL